MGETKHTPGPWIIGRGCDGMPIVHTAPDTFSPSGQGVAHVCKRPMCQEHAANAHLIAAAPDLLAALKAARETLAQICEGQHPDNVCCHHLRGVDAAIAKATEQPFPERSRNGKELPGSGNVLPKEVVEAVEREIATNGADHDLAASWIASAAIAAYEAASKP